MAQRITFAPGAAPETHGMLQAPGYYLGANAFDDKFTVVYAPQPLDKGHVSFKISDSTGVIQSVSGPCSAGLYLADVLASAMANGQGQIEIMLSGKIIGTNLAEWGNLAVVLGNTSDPAASYNPSGNGALSLVIPFTVTTV